MRSGCNEIRMSDSFNTTLPAGMTEYGKLGETRRNAEKRGKTGRNEEKRDVNEFIMQIFYPENELTLSKN